MVKWLSARANVQYVTIEYYRDSDRLVQAYQRVSINNDGSVHPCCNFEGLNLDIGNVFESSLYDIWNGETMKQMRMAVNTEENDQPAACRRCRKAVFGTGKGD